MYKKQREDFINYSKSVYGNAYIGIIQDNSEKSVIKHLGSGPCHGALINVSERGVTPDYILWCPREINLKVDKKVWESWIDWLTMESVWSHVFISKGHKEVLKYGYLADGKFSRSAVISAAIASRFMVENHSISTFKAIQQSYLKLLEVGVSIEDAFIFSHLFLFKDKGSVFTLSPSIDGHTVFDLRHSQEDLYRNFWKRDMVDFDPVPFVTQKGYLGGSAQFFLSKAARGSEAFFNRIKKMVPRVAKKKDDYNIFRKVDAKLISYPANKEGVVDIINQIKEAVNA